MNATACLSAISCCFRKKSNKHFAQNKKQCLSSDRCCFFIFRVRDDRSGASPPLRRNQVRSNLERVREAPVFYRYLGAIIAAAPRRPLRRNQVRSNLERVREAPVFYRYLGAIIAAAPRRPLRRNRVKSNLERVCESTGFL